MNYMNQIAEMLGVKLGEEFKIEGNSDKHIINNVGLFSVCGGQRKDEFLVNILTGLIKIKKIPWKPKVGDYYYHVEERSFVDGLTCEEDSIDKLYWKIGNCFKTKEEITPEIIKKYTDFFNDDERIIEI